MNKLRRQRRGRRVLAWMAATFVAGQILGGLVLDYGWFRVRFPFLYLQLERISALPAPPEIVCLGSSRFGSLVNEEEATRVLRAVSGDERVSVFNASVPAGDHVACELVVRRLLEQGQRPRFAVFEVCPESVNRRNWWLRLHVSRQLAWPDLPAYLVETTWTGNLLRLVQARLLPLYTHRESLRRHLGEALGRWFERNPKEAEPALATAAGEPAPRPNGDSAGGPVDWKKVIVGGNAPAADLQQRLLAGAVYAKQLLRSYRPGGNSAAALERILRLCRDHGIEPILVRVPVASTYQLAATPEIEAQFQAHMDALRRTYGCRLVDYRHAVPDALFDDIYHAAPEGGTLFSRRLATEVLGPAWRAHRQGPAFTLLSQP